MCGRLCLITHEICLNAKQRKFCYLCCHYLVLTVFWYTSDPIFCLSVRNRPVFRCDIFGKLSHLVLLFLRINCFFQTIHVNFRTGKARIGHLRFSSVNIRYHIGEVRVSICSFDIIYYASMIRLDTMLKMAAAWRKGTKLNVRSLCSRATCLRLESFTLHRRWEVSSLIHGTIMSSENAVCAVRWLNFLG